MSRSATPARLSAAITRSIRAAFSRTASDAVAARVTTPDEMMATSGTRVTSPVALTSSRVPPIVCVIVGPDWAYAAVGAQTAPSAAASRIFFMVQASFNSGDAPRRSSAMAAA